MFLCATSKYTCIIKYHNLGPENRKISKNHFFSPTQMILLVSKKNSYESWELAPECVKAPQEWFKGQWLANAGTQ